MNKVLKFLKEQDVIEKDKEEFIEFGLSQGFFWIINITTILLISYLFGQVMTGLLFFVFFSLLRSYAGGYHSDDILKCYFISNIIITVVIFSFDIEIWTRVYASIAIVVTDILLTRLTPVDSQNRRLSADEITLFRKKTRKILLFESVLGLIGIVYGITCVYASIGAAMILSLGLVYVGKIKNRILN